VCSVVAPVADERVAHAVEEFHCGRNVQVVKVPISSGSNTDFQLPHTDLDASKCSAVASTAAMRLSELELLEKSLDAVLGL